MTDQQPSASIFQLVDHEIFLITTAYENERSGFIATWVMPASIQKGTPRIALMSSPLNYSHSLIEKSKKMVIHLLSRPQAPLLEKFGIISGKDHDKFQGVPLDLIHQIPVIQGTCGWARTQVDNIFDIGERCIVIANVLEQRTYPERTPLRKKAAFADLPKAVQKKLAEKHQHLAQQSAHIWPIDNKPPLG